MLPPPSVIRQNLPKLSKNLKCPPPPRPKAELREAKGLPKPPRAPLPLALGGLGRALPSLSSAFGRGGGANKIYYNIIQYSTIYKSSVHYNKYITIQYNTVKFIIVQYSSVQYSIVQYSTIQ